MNQNWAKGKIIFSDIDGTFLGPNSVIIEKNYDAVQTFVQAGGLFTFSSGRLSLNRVVPGFEQLVNAPQILNNGALIQNTDGEILLEAFLDSAAAKDIISLLCGAFPSDKFGYECHMNQAGDQYYKVCFFAEPALIAEMYRLVYDRYQDKVAYFYSCPTIIEFMKPGASKGQAVRFVKQYYAKRGLNLKTYAIGDYQNDLAMLQAADVACCPDNASLEVKHVCDQILCHHSQGAVAALIEKIQGGL